MRQPMEKASLEKDVSLPLFFLPFRIPDRYLPFSSRFLLHEPRLVSDKEKPSFARAAFRRRKRPENACTEENCLGQRRGAERAGQAVYGRIFRHLALSADGNGMDKRFLQIPLSFSRAPQKKIKRKAVPCPRGTAQNADMAGCFSKRRLAGASGTVGRNAVLRRRSTDRSEGSCSRRASHNDTQTQLPVQGFAQSHPNAVARAGLRGKETSECSCPFDRANNIRAVAVRNARRKAKSASAAFVSARSTHF